MSREVFPRLSDTKMGRARTKSSRAMNSTRSSGFAAMAVTSIFAPDMTKNRGMKKP